MKWFVSGTKRAARAAARTKLREHQAIIDMVDRTQARIEFQPDGTILWANENFLKAMGYTLDEIRGRHHSIFVEQDLRASDEYRSFWARLAAGEYFQNQYPRLGKGGNTVWIRATYAPIFDEAGQVTRVVKIATDITKRQADIETLATALRRMEAGLLAQQVDLRAAPDLTLIGRAFNSALENLCGAVGSVKDVVDQVILTTRQIKESSADLAGRTERQAATLEEATAAIQEMTLTLTQAAEQARDVRRVASDAKSAAEESGKVVRDAVDAMHRIENSSSRISQITSVIDDIAFQTNLLALNAGVEAARAGEAGRGFTVVATEVRALAQRSSEAATEIKSLIDESTGDVKEGVTLVTGTGNELEKIVGNITSIATLVGEIANGTEDQSAAIAEINESLTQLDQVTQNNAAMVEENTAASEELAEYAEALAQEMGAFQTDHLADQQGDHGAEEEGWPVGSDGSGAAGRSGDWETPPAEGLRQSA